MRIVVILTLVILMVLAACTEPSQIGANFFREGSLGVFYTDTLSLHVSTVSSDSIVTGNSSRLLVGYHKDSDLGVVYASPFFQMEPRSSDAEGESNTYNLADISTDYLKTTLILWYDGYSYYDTTNYQTIYVHELTDEIESEEDGNLYNTTNTKFNPSPLGQLSFRPESKSSESIEIPLSDRLGNAIYLKAFIGDNDLSSSELFVEDVLKGLVLVPDTTVNGAVVGFGNNAELRVHYLDRSVVPSEEKYLRFFVSSNRYNRILAERSSTPLQSLKTQKESLSSTITDRKAYVQGGAALFFRVEIPYLKSILIDNPDLILTQAILSFRPIKGSEKINTPFPTQLKVYAVNKRNEIYQELSDLLSTSSADGFVTLVNDVDLNRDTHYRMNVINFIKSQLSIEEFNDNALLLSLPNQDVPISVNRLYIGDQKNDFQMDLTLHFAFVR